MAIDKRKLPNAKKMIRKFRRELCAYLEIRRVRDEVFNLDVQLVPVTNINVDKQFNYVY
jgi:hypothetical protein